MTLVSLTPNSFASNCYLAIRGEHAYVIDPSASVERIYTALREHKASCDGILLTHGHFDHMLSMDALKETYPDAPIYIHASDAENLADGEKNAFATFFGYSRAYRAADKLLREGDRLPLGDEYLEVLHTPGHTKGSVCFLGSAGDYLISGDTLFAEGYGRYDLYGGDATALIASLRRLSSLREKNPLLASGHGEMCQLADALNALGL
ncbi:MAG: MBL fold metallo-hydrolase [Clostridia bacterium]|nr:MBL fold metallo-hydrolase [Clostridia bacterium]